MKTETQTPRRNSSITQSRFGKVNIRSSARAEMATKNEVHRKKYVDWSPPMNIIQGLEYLKLELIVPGISKHDFKICHSGLLLWMKIRNESMEDGQTGIFYRTFILPENMIAEGISAAYEQNEKLVITIPKKKGVLQT